jgi:hypothetical protein
VVTDGSGQGVALGVAAQLGYAGLRQVVGHGGVHRGLLGMAWWAVFPRMRLIGTSLPVSSFACQ